MVTANDRIQGLLSTSEYEQEFFVDGTLLMCYTYKTVLNHKKKSTLNDHHLSQKHQNAKKSQNNITSNL